MISMAKRDLPKEAEWEELRISFLLYLEEEAFSGEEKGGKEKEETSFTILRSHWRTFITAKQASWHYRKLSFVRNAMGLEARKVSIFFFFLFFFLLILVNPPSFHFKVPARPALPVKAKEFKYG